MPKPLRGSFLAPCHEGYQETTAAHEGHTGLPLAGRTPSPVASTQALQGPGMRGQGSGAAELQAGPRDLGCVASPSGARRGKWEEKGVRQWQVRKGRSTGRAGGE